MEKVGDELRDTVGALTRLENRRSKKGKSRNGPVGKSVDFVAVND